MQQIQQKQSVILSAFLARWRNQRFRPSKRFVLWTCALVIIVIFSTGLFIFNNLSTDTHTRRAIVGEVATSTPNVTSATPVTAVAASTPATAPGVSGGNGGKSGNGGSSGKGGNGGNGGGGGKGGKGGNTSTPPPTTNTVTPVVSSTSTPPTSTPVVSNNNRARYATVSASSSAEGGGWGIAHVNDDITTSTPSSMGWSSAGDFVINHTEWISFDFGSALNVGRVDLFPRSDPGNVGQGFPSDFSIQLSFDGINWRTVVNETNYPLPTSTENQVFFFTPQSARYLMVQATTLRQIPSEFNRYRMQFSEICIY